MKYLILSLLLFSVTGCDEFDIRRPGTHVDMKTSEDEFSSFVRQSNDEMKERKIHRKEFKSPKSTLRQYLNS